MKTLSRSFFWAIVVLLTSCSSENDLETDLETLNAVSLQGPGIIQCTGFGLFVDTHGQQYDCGWKRGYEDWVFHYNSVANSEGFGACSELRIGLEETTDEINGTTYVTSVKTITRKVDNSPAIINRVQDLYRTYYENLTANRNNNDFNRGQFAGYNAGKGQVPYVSNSGGCNEVEGPGPFEWPDDDDDDGDVGDEKPIG